MDLRVLGWLFHARNGRLVSVFILFSLVQALFAVFYFVLYKRRRDNFAFSADILRRQGATVRSASESVLAKLQGAIGALQEATRELDRGVKPAVNGRVDASLDLPSGRKCVMVFMSSPPAGGPSGSRLKIVDSNGRTLLDVDPTEVNFRGWLNGATWLTTPAEWQAVIPRILAGLEAREQGEARRLESLATGAPDVWSYWDFLYFSTIIQTTVGLGDILPNSTLIRILVAIHIMSGYALLVVVLNIVLGS